MPAQGERIGGFILITGIDGTRYAVRQHAVTIVADADEAQDETMVHLYGGTPFVSRAHSTRCLHGLWTIGGLRQLAQLTQKPT
jgi:hypothetical protein